MYNKEKPQFIIGIKKLKGICEEMKKDFLRI
jgi:hypothetical protein